MSEIVIASSGLPNQLMQLLDANAIEPGDEPSYQICKVIYAFHPLGAKIVDKPIDLAQSDQREISVGEDVGNRLADAFRKEWRALGCDAVIAQLARTARIYAVATLGIIEDGADPTQALDYERLASADIAFNIWDPLNTAGSFFGNLSPTMANFLKNDHVKVLGQSYHPSRTVTLTNEAPLYLEYTSSGFGYTGRSVYQRILYPLQSYIQTMRTNNLVALKAGILIAKTKPAGSIVDNIQAMIAGVKRALIREARTGDVISIGPDEEISSLNLQNLDGPFTAARRNILDDCAMGAGMPAKLLNEETYAEGFGEGTEDAKAVAHYVDRFRDWLEPAYEFMSRICMYRAWTKEFHKALNKELGTSSTYNAAFYRWQNSFEAVWPSLLSEPESKKAERDESFAKTINDMLSRLLPILDPYNKGQAVLWAQENLNARNETFVVPLELDIEALQDYQPTELPEETEEDEERAATALPRAA